MMTRERHIVRGRQGRRALAALVAGAAALCCLACINEYPDADALAGQGPSLALRVSLPTITDIDYPGDDPETTPSVERMHNLRVIITHDIDGGKEMIEYNRYIDFDNTDGHFRYGYLQDPRLMFLINREWITLHKNIYLFANSEPIFDRMLQDNGLGRHPDPEGGFYGGNHRPEIKQDEMDKYIEAIKNVTFTNEELQEFVKLAGGGPANGIPMSAEYRDVSLNPGNTGVANVHVMDAYIVRAANKITFTYTNERPLRDILVQNWGLMQMNKVSYLLPHVPANDANESLFGAGTEYKGDWIAWYSDHIGTGSHDAGELNFEVPEPDLGMGPYFGVEKTWSSVVGALSGDNLYKHYYDETEYDATEDRPWYRNGLYGHYLPRWQRSSGAAASKYEPEPVYFLESIGTNNQAGMMSPDGSPVYHIQFGARHQQYLADGTPNGTPNDGGYEPSYLDKVKTLFRNTHVHVDVVFRDATPIDLHAIIIGWASNSTVFSGNLNEEE